MEQEKKLIKYGEDNFTVSINTNNKKTEDWHCILIANCPC